jgi:hypothetical protein
MFPVFSMSSLPAAAAEQLEIHDAAVHSTAACFKFKAAPPHGGPTPMMYSSMYMVVLMCSNSVD